MGSAFRRISRVGSLTGGTKWYLNEDCLLAARRVMYAVEYQRFYLRDLESIVIWPKGTWLVRLILPGVLLGALGALLWHWAIGALLWRWTDFTAAAIFLGVGLSWAGLELALGPTAFTQIRTTGATVDLALVRRVRRGRKVLAKIEAAVRVARGGVVGQTAVAAPQVQAAQASVESSSVPASTTGSIVGDLT